MRFTPFLTGLFCLLVSTASAQEVLWHYQPPVGSIDASPAAADINGDGVMEIVAGSAAGVIVAIDANGKELWQHEIHGHACFPITVADVTGDAGLEVLTMNDLGRVYCLRAESGAALWEVQLPGTAKWGKTALAVADVNGDGAPEIVTGLQDGTVVCLHGSGEELWSAPTACTDILCPAIADVDGDGMPEILVSGNGVPLVCLASDGKERWRLPKGTGGSPFVCDLDGEGSPEILLGVDDRLVALDGQGKTRWTCAMRKEIDSTIAFGDADEDGETEIYVVDLSGQLACVSRKGQVRWSASVDERVRRSPSIGDVDGDGTNEILVAGYSRALYVYDPTGRLETRIPLAGSVNATPTLATLGDAGLCAVVPVVGDGIRAFRWPNTKPGAKVLWPEFRYDAKRLGMVPADSTKPAVTLAVDFGDLYTGTNSMKATVENPEKRRLTVRLEADGLGDKPLLTSVESADDHIESKLWYTVPGTASANISFKCSVLDGGRVVAQRTHAAFTVPFAKEFTDAEDALHEVEARSVNVTDARGMDDRACFLLKKLDAVRSDVHRAGTLEEDKRIALRETLRTVLEEARTLRDLAVSAEAASRNGSPICVSAANPWAPFGGTAELTEGRVGSQSLTVKAFGGETESAAMNVYNLSGQPRTFYVEVDSLSQNDARVSGSEAVSLFEAVEVHTEMRFRSADALPRLNSANLLEVPAWGARQLWINVNTKALGSGDWTGSVRLRSLDLVPLEAACALNVKVWNAKLPEKQVLRNCGWGYVEGSLLKDFPEEALKDQISHGTNVFVSTYPPKAQFDGDGNLIGEVDFTEHDAYVKRYAAHGIILFCGYQGALQGPAPVESEMYAKAHVAWLQRWVKHLADLGVGYDGFALYPVDEPGLSNGLVAIYLRMAKLARQADPKILLYTDPVQNITVDELKEMMPYVDIWCPNRAGLVINPDSTEKLDTILKSGKPVWMYECFANAKHQSPIGYYRTQAWLAWRHGITGIGFWTYCTSPDNPWFVAPARSEYMLVYPGNGVVSSKRWEAVRDGIEDYSLLAALRDAVNDVGNAASPENIAAAKRLLNEQANSIADFCDAKTDEINLGESGFPGVRQREDQHWSQLQAAREELARLLDVFAKH